MLLQCVSFSYCRVKLEGEQEASPPLPASPKLSPVSQEIRATLLMPNDKKMERQKGEVCLAGRHLPLQCPKVPTSGTTHLYLSC